jgi:hypothetical protein
LYAGDFSDNRERHKYFSHNADGRVLYATHHFTSDELKLLLEWQGFSRINVTTEREESSKRPDVAAYFLFANCRKGTRSPRTDDSIWYFNESDQEATTPIRC